MTRNRFAVQFVPRMRFLVHVFDFRLESEPGHVTTLFLAETVPGYQQELLQTEIKDKKPHSWHKL
eukprot:2924298-Rhodomonas_salina.3